MKIFTITVAFIVMILSAHAQTENASIMLERTALNVSPNRISFQKSNLSDASFVKKNEVLHAQQTFNFLKDSKSLFSNGYDDCEQSRRLKNAGGWTILGGGIITTLGVYLTFHQAFNDNNYGQQSNTGIYLWVMGDVIQLVGTVVAVTGKIQYKHRSCAYQIKTKGENISVAFNF